MHSLVSARLVRGFSPSLLGSNTFSWLPVTFRSSSLLHTSCSIARPTTTTTTTSFCSSVGSCRLPLSIHQVQRRTLSSSSSQPPKDETPPAQKPADAAQTSTNDNGKPGSLVQRLSHLIRTRLKDQMVKSTPKNKDGTSTPAANFPDLKRLFSLAMPQKRTMLIALGLLIVSSSISLTIPFAIGKLIDFFTSGQSMLFGLGFGTVAMAMLLVFAIGAGAKAGSNILLELAGIRVIQNIRGQAYRSALRQDVELADRGAGDVVSRLNLDTNIVGESLTSDIGDGLRSGVTVVFAGTAMFLLSSKLTLLMMAVVPPAAIGAVFYGRYLRNLTHKTQDAVGSMSRLAEERLSPPAFRTVTAFNTQRQEARRFDEKVSSIVDLQTQEAFASGLFYAGTGFVGNCAVLTLLTYGGHLVSKGEISVGDLTSLLMYTAYLGGGMVNLTSFFASLMKGVGAGARVFELIDRESNVKLGVGQSLTVSANGSSINNVQRLPIVFENVHFSYPSRPDQPVLCGVNLTIEPGKSYALVGGSGAGKSSAHSLLLRYYDPTSGRITLAGNDLKSYKPESIRNLTAIVPQEPILFDGTVEDNIRYGTQDATRQDIEKAAKMAGCDVFIKHLSKGLDTWIGSRQLSGGQRQRIAIARALVKKPTILLLDEATSALDSASEMLVNKAINQIIKDGKITVWIVAHRLSTIKSASCIQVLENGKIVEQGSFDVLDRPGSRFRSLMAAQLESDLVQVVQDEPPQPQPQQQEQRRSSLDNNLSQSRFYSTSCRSRTEMETDSDYIPIKPSWSVSQHLFDSFTSSSSSSPILTEKIYQLAGLEPSLPHESLHQLVHLIHSIQSFPSPLPNSSNSIIDDTRILSSSCFINTLSSPHSSSSDCHIHPSDTTLSKQDVFKNASLHYSGYFVVDK